MYHYGGNNPIKYTDPTGEAIAVIPFIAPAVIAGVKAIGAWLGSLFVVGTVATAVGVTIDVAIDGSKSENQSDSSTDPSPLIDSGVSSAGAMPPSPDDDEDNEPNFKNSKETAKDFNTDTKNFERNIKKDILKDSKLESKNNNQLRIFFDKNKNPDIGIDSSGNIWLKSRSTGEIIKTPLNKNMYID